MQLTQHQAYLAMHAFLDAQYRMGWTDLPALLGSMSLLPDGSPADPAMQSDWLKAVEAAIRGTASARLELR